MDYRERRREQARHKKLGTILLVSSAFCGIVSAWIFAFYIPIPFPFLPYVAGFFVATLVYGGLKQKLGYDRRKASTQHLKGSSSEQEILPTHLVSESPVFDQRASEPAGSEECPGCHMKVVPKFNRTCPSCQFRFAGNVGSTVRL